MTYHKYNILLKTLAKAKEPMTSAEIAKATGSPIFSARDVGLLLRNLECEGKVVSIRKNHANYWRLAA